MPQGRNRFRFGIAVADRDTGVLVALRTELGAGSISHKPRPKAHWQPLVALTVSGRRQNVERVVPFMECWLPRHSRKYQQFAVWRDALLADVAARPLRVAGTCSVDGCEAPIRGRGLCRRHYYLATGY